MVRLFRISNSNCSRRRPLRRTLSILLFSSLYTALPASAAGLLDIWGLALARDPAYAATRYASTADQEQIHQARAQLLPHLSGNAQAGTTDRRRASTLKQYGHSNVNQWNLTLSQAIIDLQAYSLYERSKHLAAVAVLNEEQARQQLMVRVAQAYFNVLTAQDTLRSLYAQRQAVTHQLKAAEASFDLGGTSITDAYEAKARLDLVNSSIVGAESQLQVQQQALEALIAEPAPILNGLSTNDLPTPEPSQPETWASQAAQRNLSVLKAELNWLSTQAALDAAKSEHAPTLSLEARTGSTNQQGVYQDSRSPRALDSSIGLELKIPLYSGGAISSRIREQTARLQQQNFEKEDAKRNAITAARQYFTDVNMGLLQVRALQAAERSSQASLDANELAYEVGVRINIDVLNAQQQLYETQRALSKARYDTLLNSLRLKEAAGTLNDADLQALDALLDQPQPAA